MFTDREEHHQQNCSDSFLLRHEIDSTSYYYAKKQSCSSFNPPSGPSEVVQWYIESIKSIDQDDALRSYESTCHSQKSESDPGEGLISDSHNRLLCVCLDVSAYSGFDRRTY